MSRRPRLGSGVVLSLSLIALLTTTGRAQPDVSTIDAFQSAFVPPPPPA